MPAGKTEDGSKDEEISVMEINKGGAHSRGEAIALPDQVGHRKQTIDKHFRSISKHCAPFSVWLLVAGGEFCAPSCDWIQLRSRF